MHHLLWRISLDQSLLPEFCQDHSSANHTHLLCSDTAVVWESFGSRKWEKVTTQWRILPLFLSVNVWKLEWGGKGGTDSNWVAAVYSMLGNITLVGSRWGWYQGVTEKIYNLWWNKIKKNLYPFYHLTLSEKNILNLIISWVSGLHISLTCLQLHSSCSIHLIWL